MEMAGLPVAIAIAIGFIMLKPRRRRRTRWRTTWRIMLSRRIWLHSSALLDFQYYVAGVFAFSVLLGYVVLTGAGVSKAVSAGLTGWLGPHETPEHLPIYLKALIILGLYMSFELAYWFDHFLSHKIPFLWEFHKVHHAAAVLTPFTNARVHPVDTLVYLNIQTIFVGSASGLIQYFAGDAFSLLSTAICGLLFAVYMALWGHLQHSQLWISFTGLAGRIILSPAHHQIHHSRDPVHFDKNFGAGLALFDWLFGTLHIPERHNEHLRFGTEGDAHLQQLIPSVIYPFHYAARRIIALARGKSTSESVDLTPAPKCMDALEITIPHDRLLDPQDIHRRSEDAIQPTCGS
jgi:sterol desaturase/sphingolipid hydroxylase (fatty acid hydroxylase superfamily)